MGPLPQLLRSQTPGRRRADAFRPRVEVLEARHLPSGVLGAAGAGGLPALPPAIPAAALPVDVELTVEAPDVPPLVGSPGPLFVVTFTHGPFVLRAEAAAAPEDGTPTGLVTFLSDGTFLGTAPLVNGQAALTVATEADGVHVLTAVYPGDTRFDGAVSDPVHLVVLAGFLEDIDVPVRLLSQAANTPADALVPRPVVSLPVETAKEQTTSTGAGGSDALAAEARAGGSEGPQKDLGLALLDDAAIFRELTTRSPALAPAGVAQVLSGADIVRELLTGVRPTVALLSLKGPQVAPVPAFIGTEQGMPARPREKAAGEGLADFLMNPALPPRRGFRPPPAPADRPAPGPASAGLDVWPRAAVVAFFAGGYLLAESAEPRRGLDGAPPE